MENLQLLDDSTTKQARTISTRGNRSRGAQQVKYVGNTDVFSFGFNFMSPEWTRTKLIFVVPLYLQA